MRTVNIARDFSRFPAGRKAAQSKTSGEEFRRRFLEPAVRAGEPVAVELDGVLGYGSSFLEEAFGGLVREFRLDPERFAGLVQIRTESGSLRLEIDDYVRQAASEAKHPVGS